MKKSNTEFHDWLIKYYNDPSRVPTNGYVYAPYVFMDAMEIIHDNGNLEVRRYTKEDIIKK